jgi:large subunit ribosomal protein L10
MSKYVKDLITRELQQRFDGVDEALLVNVVGLNANRSVQLRQELRSKGIELLVVKNSLARRATEGTPLAKAFEQLEGNLAICWGAADIVSLAKEVTRLAADSQYAPFAARGGVLDGKQLTPDEVVAVSKWPTRAEQLSLLSGQLLAPAATLSGQLLAPGAALSSQLQSLGEEQEPEDSPEEGAAGEEPSA